MSATVQGVFTILDRASPKMRDMRHEAEKTQAAIESLGLSLDKVGSSKQIKNLDNLNRRLKVSGQEASRTSTQVKNATTALDKHTNAVRKTESMWKRLSGTFGLAVKDLTGGVAKLGAMTVAIGVAGQAIGQLSGGVLALASKVGSLGSVLAAGIAGVTGIGLAAVTAKLAFGDFSQAMKGNAQAIRNLTPQARSFMLQLKGMRSTFVELKQSAQRGIFTGLSSALSDFKTAVPTVNAMLGNMSNVLGKVIAQQAHRFTRGGFLLDFQQLGGQGAQMVGALGRSLGNIVDALRHVGIAAMPFTNWLTRTIEGWSKFVDGAARSGRETGRLTVWFQRAEKSLTQLGHIVENLFHGFQSLLRAAQPLGDLLFGDAERGSKAWATMLGSQKEQTRLMTMMLKMEPGIKALFGIVGDLGRAIFQMGSSTQFSRTVNNLRGAIPSIQQALTKMADTFGPAFATAITNLAKLFSDISTAASPLVVAAKAVGQIAGFIDRIANAVTPIKDIFSILFSTVIISRYLIKLGILEKGWWNVFRATTAAAGASKVAMEVGAVGGATVVTTGRGAGGSSGAVILGPTGRGIKGKLGGLFGRGAAAEGEAGLLSRVAGTAAGRFILPIAAIQGVFGALSAGRSGGLSNQLAQTAYGGVNGATGGLLGGGLGLLGMHHILETPESRATRNAATGQSAVDARLDQVTAGGMAGLISKLRILNRAVDDVSDRQTQASKEYIQSLQDQTAGIKDQIRAMNEQKRARDIAKGNSYAASVQTAVNTAIAHGGDPAAKLQAGNEGLIAQIARKAGHPGEQINLANHLLQSAQANRKALPGQYRSAASAVTRLLPDHPGTYNQHLIYGSRADQAHVIALLDNYGEQQREKKNTTGLTPMQGWLVAELVRAGMPEAQARAKVQAGEKTGYANFQPWTSPNMRPHTYSPSQKAQGANLITSPGRATGGRLGGHGLNDTVALPGAMAAPGELVVNRHTERKVNAALGNRTLGAMVAGENKRHNMATGGRLSWDPGITGAGVNPTLLKDVESLTSEGSVRITSGFRSIAKQAALYQAYVNSGYNIAHIAAKPGASGHNYGLAMDVFVNGSGAQNLGPAVLARHGLVAPVKGDLEHVELANDSPQLIGLSTAIARSKGNLGAILRSDTPGVLNLPAGKAGGGGARTTFTSSGLPSLISDQFASVDALTGLPGFSTAPRIAIAHSGGGGQATGGGKAGGGGTTATKFTGKVNAQGVPVPLMSAINTASSSYGLNPNMLVGIWHVESGSKYPNPYGNSLGYGGLFGTSNWHDSTQAQANMSAQILSRLIREKGDTGAALRAYSGGGYSSIQQYLGSGGRVPQFAGWHAGGLNGTFSTPTLIGVGEKGSEQVTVTPTGKSGSKVTLNNTFHIHGGTAGNVQREVEAALMSLVNHLQNIDVPA